MITNFKAIDDDSYNCLENLINSVTQYYGRSCELMSLYSWLFRYNREIYKEEHSFGNAITDSTFGKSLESLAKYHGVIMNYNDKKLFNEFSKVIQEEISNDRPVIICMDTFYCPWYVTDYNKLHTMHYCLVIDIDNENKIFSIVDTQFAQEAVQVSFDYIEKGYNDFYTIHITDSDLDNMNWKDILSETIKYMKNTLEGKTFEELRSFADDFESYICFSTEIRGYENTPLKSSIFKKIHTLSNKRKQYSRVFEFIRDKFEVKDMEVMAYRMKNIADRWSSTFGLLCKAFYKNDNAIISRVSDKLRTLADLEEELFNDLCCLCLDKKIVGCEVAKSEHDCNEVKVHTFVELEEYFNNKGYGEVKKQNEMSDLSNQIAEFSDGHKFFVLDELEYKSELCIENMKFRIPGFKHNNFDNVVCLGQKIEIKENAYDCIMVLGSADLGDHFEDLIIEFTDGTIEKICIQMSNWCKNAPYFDEKIAWTGKRAQVVNNETVVVPFDVHIFGKNYKINSDSYIKALILPDCPNMHIFSLTLGKY